MQRPLITLTTCAQKKEGDFAAILMEGCYKAYTLKGFPGRQRAKNKEEGGGKKKWN